MGHGGLSGEHAVLRRSRSTMLRRMLMTDDDELQRILTESFPDAAVSAVEELPGGETHRTYRIDFRRRDSVVVKYTVNGTARLRRDRAALQYVRERTPVPVPHVLALGEDPTYAVIEACHGETTPVLADFDPDNLAGLRAAGRTLADLHDTTGFDRFGRVEGTPDGTLRIDPADSWPTLYRELTADTAAELRGTRFEAVADDGLAALNDAMGRLGVDAPVLIHCDFGPNNVFRANGEVVGVIDWEWSLAGDPVYDLARAESLFCRNAEADAPREALFGGYREVRPLFEGFERRRELYRALLMFGAMSTFDSWGPRVTDDLDALAGRMRETFRNRLPTR